MAKKKNEKKEIKVPTEKKKFGGKQEGSGRPKKEIDVDLVKKLAMIHCTKEEIASIVGCCKDTLYERFPDVLREGDEEGKMSLKRKMHEIALSGNVQMLIWLSKQRLGYKERQPEDAQQIIYNVTIKENP